MGRSAFQALGATKEQAELMKDAFNDMDRKSMLALAEHYDPAIPAVENETYIAKVREWTAEWEEDLRRRMHNILGGPPA
jgi:CPA2 family monovalent cation:H+ antiporter-2